MEITETYQFIKSKWITQYLSNTSNVHSFYEYVPLKEDAFIQRAVELDSEKRMQVPREKLVEVLSSYHEPELLHPKVKQNIDRLRHSDSLVVIGGHQACLLTGPLYTIYKAITLLQLAEREEKRLGRPVIPVFWIAGEDHDWDEVNHVWIQKSSTPVKVRFSPRSNRKSISEISCIPEEVQVWIDHLSQLLPDSSYKKEWVSILKEFSATPIAWTRFFARIMNYLFGKHGLLLMDAADSELRKLEKPFWDILITKNKEIQKKIQEKLNEFTRLGYSLPIPDKKNYAHLFICSEGNRYPLYFDGITWTASGLSERWTTSELQSLACDFPHLLSNNVMTRPLMQEYIFPTLSFVGGFSEITYWGLLKDVFTLCGLQMPIVYPRSQITLVSSTIRRRMREYKLTPSDVYTCFEEKKKNWFQKQKLINTDFLFKEARREILLIHEHLLHQLDKNLDINLMESGQINQNKIVEHLEYLEKSTEKIIRNKFDVEISRWDEIASVIYPSNKPQERVYNLINYWNAYGVEWIDRLINAPLLCEDGSVNFVSIP